MNEFDQITLSLEKFDDKYNIRRVLNKGGVPYTVIEDRQKRVEIASIPTTEERRMLEWFKDYREREIIDELIKITDEIAERCFQSSESLNEAIDSLNNSIYILEEKLHENTK